MSKGLEKLNSWSGAFRVVFVEDIQGPWEIGIGRKEGRKECRTPHLTSQHLTSRNKLNKAQYSTSQSRTSNHQQPRIQLRYTTRSS